MNPFLMFLRAYWVQIAIATACLIVLAYVTYLKHEINGLKRDNASLTTTIQLAKALGKNQSDKADRIEEGGRKAAVIITNQYTTDLQKVKAYYASHPTIKHVTNSVCSSTNNPSVSQVSTTPSSASGTNDTTTNPVSTGQDLEPACAETTLMLVKLQDFERTQQAISGE
jgi:hypothetical protein